jgi:hypothetical protein
MKGLVETRARAAADHQGALEVATLRINHLNDVIQAQQREQTRIQKEIARAQAQAKQALEAQQACDQLILNLQKYIDPSHIEPIKGWQGKYGQRGTLGQAVQAFVEAAYPLEVTTLQVAAAIQHQFQLDFPTPKERATWVRASISNQLQYLIRLGCIERLHDPAARLKRPGRWRAVPANLKGNDLITLASQAGIPLTFFSGELSALESPEEDDLPR